jgi:hypothetical protein
VVPPVEATEDFRKPLLWVDIGMLALGGLIAAQVKQPVFMAAAYAAGAPAVHAYYGDYWGAAPSFALHGILPIGFGYLTYKAGASHCHGLDETEGWCDGVDFAFGAIVGVILASTIDIGAFGERKHVLGTSTLAPVVTASTSGHVLLGAAGRF